MSWPSNRWPTSKEMLDRLRELAADQRFTSICKVFDLPNQTQEGRTTNFVRIGRGDAGSPSRNRVVIIAGLHARELAPPAAVTNLVSVLLEASVAKNAITIGSAVRSADDVKAIIENVDLYVAPMINPDGYDFTFVDPRPISNTYSGWRKNRRPPPANLPSGCSAASPDAIGVDVNRNFDVLWDFEKFYVQDAQVASSKNPCDESFIGDATLGAFSEPESKNARSLIEKDPHYFVDVHMHGGNVYHSWGVEMNKEIAGPTPVLNPGRVRDGTRNPGQPGYNGYAEPINKDFVARARAVANLMADATGLATPGNRYNPVIGAQLGSISGASDDFTFSRNVGTGKTLATAFTMECGKNFLPRFDTEFPDIQREVQAALLALLRHAATPATAPKSSSCNSCSVAD